jgi:transketolase
MNISQLQINARAKVLNMVLQSREGHVASSFSIIEILVAIYSYLQNTNQTDKFCSHTILSKGHSVYALYAIMSELGKLTNEELSQVGQYGSYLIGHVPVRPENNFFVGTGSLGQGLPMALGRAYVNHMIHDSCPQFVIVGDGELNEGSCWETLLLMQKFPNCKLRLFVDNNHSSTRAIPLHNIFKALRQGWNTVDVNGHSVHDIVEILSKNDSDENLIILCETKKGFPLQAMNNPIWHHRMPTASEVAEFNQEIREFFGG